MTEELDYARDITIDPTALDVEWLQQPRLFMRYAEEAAHARKHMDRAKERVEVMRAEIDNEIRNNADKKPTETAIANLILMDPRFKEAQARFNEAKHDFDIMQAAVRAMDQKKDALENLVRLHAANYFAGPSVPRDIGKEFAERARQEGAREKAKERMGTSHRTK